MLLISNWKAMGGLAIGIAFVNIAIMVLKASWTDKWFIWDTKAPLVKRAIIIVLGQVAGIMLMIVSGMKWYAAVIAGLITAGGAIAIYEAVAPIFKKD